MFETVRICARHGVVQTESAPKRRRAESVSGIGDGTVDESAACGHLGQLVDFLETEIRPFLQRMPLAQDVHDEWQHSPGNDFDAADTTDLFMPPAACPACHESECVCGRSSRDQEAEDKYLAGKVDCTSCKRWRPKSGTAQWLQLRRFADCVTLDQHKYRLLAPGARDTFEACRGRFDLLDRDLKCIPAVCFECCNVVQEEVRALNQWIGLETNTAPLVKQIVEATMIFVGPAALVVAYLVPVRTRE